MWSYDPTLLIDAAAKILLLSAPGTKTKVAMEVAGFQKIEDEYERYRKRIERKRNRLMALHPSDIFVHEGSTTSTSTLSCSTEDEEASIVVVVFTVVLIEILTFCSVCSLEYGKCRYD